jgi:hypothetical protein
MMILKNMAQGAPSSNGGTCMICKSHVYPCTSNPRFIITPWKWYPKGTYFLDGGSILFTFSKRNMSFV